LKGFKAFLLRGNVLDLAVAVVIGAALTSVINALVNGVINPIVGAFGTSDLNDYKSCLKGPCSTVNGVSTGITIAWGSVLAALLQFVITAAVVYFCIVVPAGKMLERYLAKKKVAEEAAAQAEVTEVALLGEIRDLLARQG
jgi:large conductance mechanosensitive channel